MINNIFFGIKISNHQFNLISSIYKKRDIIDFIEIILKSDFNRKDLAFIKDLKIPYAIHLANSNDGIDFGNNIKEKNNTVYIEKINNNIDIFGEMKPICYIIHPESGDLNYSIDNIMKLKIRPLAIENMPVKGIHGEIMLGYDPPSLSRYFNIIKDLQFCFDINHAIKSSISLKIDSYKFIKNFLKFKSPIIFHIAGGDMNDEVDKHLNLNEGQYDISKIKKILFNFKKKVYLTFETPKKIKNHIKEDLKNMEFFLNI
ncbi:MAG: TIM barrel protein [Promethearchaeota archaeon]